MRRIILYSVLSLAAVLFTASCGKDNPSGDSIIVVPSDNMNPFDKWLEANYVDPYNIEVKYRYEMDETLSYSYYTVPADLDCSIILAHLVKYLCIDAYDEVVGISFTRHYFPKMFYFIGEWEYNNNNTFRLGTAEGGRKIFLTGVNYVQAVIDGTYKGMGASAVNWSVPGDALNHFYIKTIHHEFTHILNQTKDLPNDFVQVTPTDYVNDEWNEFDDYLQKGIISAYAQKNEREDFAEMMSLYITNPKSVWDGWVTAAGTDGAALIQTKIDIVKSYMKSNFDISLDDLRDVVLRRQSEVASGAVDLTSLDVK